MPERQRRQSSWPDVDEAASDAEPSSTKPTREAHPAAGTSSSWEPPTSQQVRTRRSQPATEHRQKHKNAMKCGTVDDNGLNRHQRFSCVQRMFRTRSVGSMLLVSRANGQAVCSAI